MRVEVIDRWRNVRKAPIKALSAKSDPFAALDKLLDGHNAANGQIEFECDKTFHDALLAQSDAQLEKPTHPWKSGHLSTYNGVPIVVTDAP